MGFSGEVDDGVDLMLGEQASDQGGITDVAVRKDVARITGEVGQVGGVAGVGEGVEVDEPGERGAGFEQALPDEIGADEAAAAGDEKVHEVEDGTEEWRE